MERKSVRMDLRHGSHRISISCPGRRGCICTGASGDVGMGRRCLVKGTQTLNDSLPASAELQRLLDLAVDLSRQAAEVHRHRQTGEVNPKSTATDLVSQVDHDAERVITAGIRRARPDDGILGEEETLIVGSSGLQWVIDPLDGTVNYLYGFPNYSVSIAIELDGLPIIGVVYDTSRDKLYRARIDSTATSNGQSIGVTSCTDLSTALLGTGFAYESSTRGQQALVLTKLLPQVRDIRRTGSCAIDLCLVASGRLDAFYETGVQWWDVAAGLAIIRAAGGVAVYEPLQKRVLASGPLLWQQLCETVNQAEIVTDHKDPPPSATI
ncbi:uncharacterized protein METZ01_LOCUS28755 [marine metagenome]|uniref:inositol-phosphate phosphatase n=1 Tax=marine metagenome TaxID=408172 RepID=A0A381Q992_9ZZZZ